MVESGVFDVLGKIKLDTFPSAAVSLYELNWVV